MFGLGIGEILIIVFLILLVFGSKKLPGLGGALGKSIKNFKKGLQEGNTKDDEKEKKE